MRRGWWDRSERLRFALTVIGAAAVFYAMSQYQVAPASTGVRDTAFVAETPSVAEVVAPQVTAIPAVEDAGDVTTINMGPGWTWWGDSLTAGAGSDGETAPAALSRLIGEPVFNFGVNGERSDQIAARANGAPAVLTVVGGLIPASGGIPVQPDVELLRSGPRSLDGTLGGVEGRLGLDDAGAYTFARGTDGEPVQIDAAPFLTTTAAAYRDHDPIVWLGRNNVADTERVVADTEAILDHHAVIDHRYLVLSILNGGVEEGTGTPGHTAVTATNAALEQGWPDNFVDVRRCLVDTGLARLGITPTPDDDVAIAADAVPPSLRSDGLHLTEGGYQVIAGCIADWLTDRGWVVGAPADAILAE